MTNTGVNQIMSSFLSAGQNVRRTRYRSTFLVRTLLAALAFAVVSEAHAWWNEDWQFRKDLSVSVPAGVTSDVEFVPVLLRLHVGNFGYFGDTAPDGADIRFVASDDLTIYKHYIESYDPIAFLANVWVMVPRVTAAAPVEIKMYYGNAEAVSSSDPAFFGIEQAMVLHFDGQGSQLKDATAYNQSLSSSSDLHVSDSLIHGGLNFSGTNDVASGQIASTPLTAADGFSVSAWIKPDDIEAGTLWRLSNVSGDSVVLELTTSSYLLTTSVQGEDNQINTPAAPSVNAWQHVAVSASSGETRVYVNGSLAAGSTVSLPDVLEQIEIGGGANVPYSGLMDEFRLATVAHPPERFALLSSLEGMGSTNVFYGGDQTNEEAGGGQPNYMVITLQNVSTNGWVVIGILFVMALISWIVMVVKSLHIRRTRKDNSAFLRDFYSSDLEDISELDRDEDDALLGEGGGLLDAIGGPSDHYQSSTIYHLYHAGVQESKRRLHGQGSTVGAQHRGTLRRESVDAIRATLDANMVREIQKLNSMMVVLTIAIAGGPFLGLLGTVIGVMITFAAIAASGDVNISAIAPGVAAALATTVAGLAVAIPALFAYNYFATRIKEIVADMRVFLDEFVTRVAEQYRGI